MALRIPGFPIPDLDPTDERRKRLNANGGCGCPSRCFRRFCPCLCDGRTCSSSTCNCPGTLCSDKPLVSVRFLHVCTSCMHFIIQESEEAPQAALESVPTHAPQVCGMRLLVRVNFLALKELLSRRCKLTRSVHNQRSLHCLQRMMLNNVNRKSIRL